MLVVAQLPLEGRAVETGKRTHFACTLSTHTLALIDGVHGGLAGKAAARELALLVSDQVLAMTPPALLLLLSSGNVRAPKSSRFC